MAEPLIDTDVLIDHLRGTSNPADLGMDPWCYLVVTRCELFAGTDHEDEVRQLLSRGVECPVTSSVAETAGRIRRVVRIATPDAMIAATAIIGRRILVTRNLRHFAQVPGLRVESP